MTNYLLIHISEVTAYEIKKTKPGESGGFQGLMLKLQRVIGVVNFDMPGEKDVLRLPAPLAGEVLRCFEQYKTGGFQTRLRPIAEAITAYLEGVKDGQNPRRHEQGLDFGE